MRAARELVLGSEALEVVLLPELGARLHRIRAFGHDLLRTPEDPALHATDPFFWGAYVMAPWCNRAPAGAREIAGHRLDLSPNFADGSAIHGLVFADRWEVTDSEGSLAIARGGRGTAWPWPFEVRLHAEVDGDSLRLDYRLLNRSDSPMPAGLGLHPWFRAPLALRVPGSDVYPTNIGSPIDPDAVSGTLDLRTLAPPAAGLDATWAMPSSSRIDIAWPHHGVTATVDIETSGRCILVAVASPGTIDAVAIEPQTHGPDPFRRLDHHEPDAPQMLGPGDELRMTIRFEVASGKPTNRDVAHRAHRSQSPA